MHTEGNADVRTHRYTPIVLPSQLTRCREAPETVVGWCQARVKLPVTHIDRRWTGSVALLHSPYNTCRAVPNRERPDRSSLWSTDAERHRLPQDCARDARRY